MTISLIRCHVPKGPKRSVLYDFGVIVQSLDGKVKHFYCLANGPCCYGKSKCKMSSGCTSGPSDHLRDRHGVRTQRSLMIENTKTELLGKRYIYLYFFPLRTNRYIVMVIWFDTCTVCIFPSDRNPPYALLITLFKRQRAVCFGQSRVQNQRGPCQMSQLGFYHGH